MDRATDFPSHAEWRPATNRRKRRSRPIDSGSWDLRRGGTYVYRVYDGRGTLLYVGLADNLGRRMADHLSNAEWAHLAARVDWDLWPTRAAAMREESRLIGELKPLYNIVGNDWSGPIPLPPVPWKELPPAEQQRQAIAAHRRLSPGDRL